MNPALMPQYLQDHALARWMLERESAPEFKDTYGDVDARKYVGAWRWKGIYDNRKLILRALRNGGLDLGGAQGPVGCGTKVVDMLPFDDWGRRVWYHEIEEAPRPQPALFASHFLEHTPDPPLYLLEMWRTLKPGGWAVIQVPSVSNIFQNHPVFNKKHTCIWMLDGIPQDGWLQNILPLRPLVEPFFREVVGKYVLNCSILFVGRRRRAIKRTDTYRMIWEGIYGIRV